MAAGAGVPFRPAQSRGAGPGDGGAAGNLLNRLRSPQGVVDFIDIGVGATRFYTFNVADIGVCAGAILLAWAFWREDREREAAPSASGTT